MSKPKPPGRGGRQKQDDATGNNRPMAKAATCTCLGLRCGPCSMAHENWIGLGGFCQRSRARLTPACSVWEFQRGVLHAICVRSEFGDRVSAKLSAKPPPSKEKASRSPRRFPVLCSLVWRRGHETRSLHPSPSRSLCNRGVKKPGNSTPLEHLLPTATPPQCPAGLPWNAKTPSKSFPSPIWIDANFCDLFPSNTLLRSDPIATMSGITPRWRR